MIGVVQSGYGAAQRDVRNGVYLTLGDLYPGSLNLRIEKGELAGLGEPDMIIPGPECALWLWLARIGDHAVWLMHPHRWPPITSASIVEVFAAVRLRDALDVDDGEEVEVVRSEVGELVPPVGQHGDDEQREAADPRPPVATERIDKGSHELNPSQIGGAVR